MGGETIERADETGEIEDVGSVGDWRLPAWMPRISGVAWLFIGLAFLSVVEPFMTWVQGYGWVLWSRSGSAFTAIARALPILLPAAALWRTDRPRPRSLLLGSVAVGIGAVISSIYSEAWVGVDPVFGGGGLWQPYNSFEVPWVTTIAFTFVGPVLLANVLRGAGRVAPRRAIGTGLAVGAITVGYLAMTVIFPVYLYQLYVNDPSYPGGWFGTPLIVSVMPSALTGWAYFAWVVLAAETDSRRRWPAWRMATAGVLIQQGTVVLNLAAMAFWYIVARRSEDTPGAEVAVWISGAAFFVTPILLIVASVLLVAAFARGLADPASDVPDRARTELEPIPNPG